MHERSTKLAEETIISGSMNKSQQQSVTVPKLDLTAANKKAEEDMSMAAAAEKEKKE